MMNSSSFPGARSANVFVNGHDTQINAISFADKMLFTVSQTGTMTHWVHVPLSGRSDAQLTSQIEYSEDDENAMLPASHLTATTVLGGTRQEDETLGQTLAATLASAVLLKHPDDSRLLVLGLGLQSPALYGKAQFDELLGSLLPFI